MLELRLLFGLHTVTRSKKTFSWEYSSVTSLPLKIWARGRGDGEEETGKRRRGRGDGDGEERKEEDSAEWDEEGIRSGMEEDWRRIGREMEEEWEQVSFRFDKFFVFNNVCQSQYGEKSESPSI